VAVGAVDKGRGQCGEVVGVNGHGSVKVVPSSFRQMEDTENLGRACGESLRQEPSARAFGESLRQERFAQEAAVDLSNHHSIPHHLSKVDCAKQFMKSSAGMPMGNSQAHCGVLSPPGEGCP
jgi:hypothetical protein